MAVCALLAACNGLKNLEFKSTTPYEDYAGSLKEAGLDASRLGSEWLKAGARALRDSMAVEIPYAETGYFSAAEPEARGVNFYAREGTALSVSVTGIGQPEARCFIDLYERGPEGKVNRLASAAKNSLRLSYEIDNDGDYVIRVQPELLSEGYYQLRIETFPALSFPVSGKDYKAIGSVFGDPRDGGRRRHEGVDIFAARLSPVTAAVNGRITRVTNYGMGGKAVWLWDPARNISLYYAHLDSQLVSPGQKVSVGDTVGLMGNTGNARHTPPHLHFGIYKRGRGAADPYPYLYQPVLETTDYADPPERIHTWVAISARKANIRRSPSTRSAVVRQLLLDTPVFVAGVSGEWLAVVLPDGSRGFLHRSITKAISPIDEIAPEKPIVVYDGVSVDRSALGPLEPVPTLAYGRFGDFWLVKYFGTFGWIML